MTVSSTSRLAGPFTGNGADAQLPFAFKVFVPDDIVVARDGVILALGTHYSLTLNPDQDAAPGGIVAVLAANYTVGATFHITSDMPATQLADLPSQSPWRPQVIENALDKLTILIQQFSSEGALLDRALKVPVGESVNDLEIADVRKGKYLVWDAAGQPISSHGTGADLGLREDLGEPTGSALVGDDGGTRWQSVAEYIDFMSSPAGGQWLTPEMFGALGDGVTNDSDAFTALGAAVNAAGGGSVLIPSRTYLVGKQTFAGAAGKGYSYLLQKIMYFENCTWPVVVNFQGRIKLAAGLRYGGFNPITGLAQGDNSFPFDKDLKADTGFVIAGINCPGGVYVYGGGEIDGNMAAINLGGVWGDTGRQIAGFGIYYTNTPGVIADIHIHHCCLDGVAVIHNPYAANQPGLPMRLERVRSRYNARQGLTWAGGRGLQAISCEFALTGRGTFSSSPASGVDIEPDSGAINRDGLFLDCVFADNLGVGMVTDNPAAVYNLLFIGCRFYGTTQYSVLTNAPGVTYESCLFSGAVAGNYAAARPADATRFLNCLFKPLSYQGSTPYIGGVGLMDFQNTIVAKNCLFDNGNDPAIAIGAALPTVEFHSCTFQQSNCALGAIVRGTFYGSNIFKMDSGSNDFSGSLNRGFITGNGTWLSLGHVNNRGGAISAPYYELNRMGINSVTYQINRSTGAITFPVAGPGNPSTRGDFIWNTEPVAGGAYGWLCTVSGDPGTWVPLGIVSAVRCASIPPAVAAPTKAEFDALVNALRTAKLMA